MKKPGIDGVLDLDFPTYLTAVTLCYIRDGWTLLADIEDCGGGRWRGLLLVTKDDSDPFRIFEGGPRNTREEAEAFSRDLVDAMSGGEWDDYDFALASAVVRMVRTNGWFKGPDRWDESHRMRCGIRNIDPVQA